MLELHRAVPLYSELHLTAPSGKRMGGKRRIKVLHKAKGGEACLVTAGTACRTSGREAAVAVLAGDLCSVQEMPS